MHETPPSSCSALPVSTVPMSTGPAADLVVLEASVPASVASGGELPVEVSLHVRRDGPRIVTSTAGSELLVTRGGRVVARSSGSSGAGLTVPLELRAGAVRPGQVVPGTVRLVGCATGSTVVSGPLPPGRYAVVAVLAYGGDPLDTSAGGGSGRFQVVSRPVPVTVT